MPGSPLCVPREADDGVEVEVVGRPGRSASSVSSRVRAVALSVHERISTTLTHLD